MVRVSYTLPEVHLITVPFISIFLTHTYLFFKGLRKCVRYNKVWLYCGSRYQFIWLKVTLAAMRNIVYTPRDLFIMGLVISRFYRTCFCQGVQSHWIFPAHAIAAAERSPMITVNFLEIMSTSTTTAIKKSKLRKILSLGDLPALVYGWVGTRGKNAQIDASVCGSGAVTAFVVV